MSQALCFSLFLFFLLITSSGFAQQDTLRSKSYIELRDMITENMDIQNSNVLELSEYYIAKALNEGNLKEQLWGYESVGLAYLYLRDEFRYEEALDKAMDIALSNNLKKEINRLDYEMATQYFFFGKWGKSLELYNKSLVNAKLEKDFHKESFILSQIASIKIYAGNKSEALEMSRLALKQSLKIAQEPDSIAQIRKTAILNRHYTLVRVFQELNQPDSSLYHADIVLATREVKDSCRIKYVYTFKAVSYLDQNNTKEANRSLDKADNICRSINKESSILLETTRGRLYLYQKKYRKSIDAILKGINDYGVTEESEGFMDEIYKNLAKAYKGNKQLDSANFYLEKYINTSSEFDKIKKDVSTTAKKQEVALFKEELNELSKQKAQKDNLLIYGSIGGGAVILFLVFGLVGSNKKRKENEQKFEMLLAKVVAADEPKDIIDTKDEVLEEQSTSDINPETTQQIIEGLKKLEEQNYFLHPACSAHNVAKRIKTNTTYLSKVINAEFGKNFSTYVNDLRINYAIVRLKQDTQFRNYTISSIAKELGYKSADSFTKYFKKDTGLLPSFYIKKLNRVA